MEIGELFGETLKASRLAAELRRGVEDRRKRKAMRRRYRSHERRRRELLEEATRSARRHVDAID